MRDRYRSDWEVLLDLSRNELDTYYASRSYSLARLSLKSILFGPF